MCIISGIQSDHKSNNDEITVTQSPATGRELTHNESQSVADSYQSFSLPQETNTMSSFSHDSDSIKIVDWKGTLFYRCVCIYVCTVSWIFQIGISRMPIMCYL